MDCERHVKTIKHDAAVPADGVEYPARNLLDVIGVCAEGDLRRPLDLAPAQAPAAGGYRDR